jgi:hypothetical protein
VFSVRRSAFSVRRSAFSVRRPSIPTTQSSRATASDPGFFFGVAKANLSPFTLSVLANRLDPEPRTKDELEDD